MWDCLRHWNILWPALLSVRFVLMGGLAWTSWSHRCVHDGSQYDSHCLCSALADFSVPLLWGLVHSQWQWAPHIDTRGRGDIVCNHNLQDWQAFLAIRCCCCQTLSVVQNSVEVDPKIFQMTCRFDYNCDFTSLYLLLCCQKCTTVFMPCKDWWEIRCRGTTGIRYPVGFALLLLPPGRPLIFRIYKPVICQCGYLSGPILVRICQAVGVYVVEDRL